MESNDRLNVERLEKGLLMDIRVEQSGAPNSPMVESTRAEVVDKELLLVHRSIELSAATTTLPGIYRLARKVIAATVDTIQRCITLACMI